MITNREVALGILEVFYNKFEEVKAEHQRLIKSESELEEIIEQLPKQTYLKITDVLVDLTTMLQETAYLIGLKDGMELHGEFRNKDMVKEIIRNVWPIDENK